jgi:hypothetical protein
MFEYQLLGPVVVNNEPMKPAARQTIIEITSNSILFMRTGKIMPYKKLVKKISKTF